ncbi:hypothetical protein [Echinicola pacifica]|nr:hypothetical protein [Echinicola pacifica]
MMKSMIIAALAIGVVLTSCENTKKTEEVTETETGTEMAAHHSEAKEVTYKVAEKYFIKNDAGEVSQVKFETAEEFNSVFGMATVMGEGGKPTAIDFENEYVIAVVMPATNKATKLEPVSLMEDDHGHLTFSYEAIDGEEQTHSIKPVLLVIVDKDHNGEVHVEKI